MLLNVLFITFYKALHTRMITNTREKVF